MFVVLGLMLIGQTALAANDPYYFKQWYLTNIKADKAWAMTTGSSSVVVAVIDTGVDLDQPDLQDNIWKNTLEIAGDGKDNEGNGYIDDVYGWDFVKNQANASPNLNGGYDSTAVHHGTFIAGLISAMHDNNFGIKGVTARVKIMPLVGLSTTGYGSSLPVAKAINYAVANGAHIINLSFGGSESSQILKDSINNAYHRNVLIVAAVGNAVDGKNGTNLTNNPIYPVCYDKTFTENKILGVIATDQNNRVTPYSNYGLGCVDIAAPGDSMISLAYQNSNFTSFQAYLKEGWRGTSFSAALVSGTAALMKSVNDNLSAKQIIEIIREESGLLMEPAGKAGMVGNGLLDVSRAVTKAMNVSGTTSGIVVPPAAPPAPIVIPGTPAITKIMTNSQLVVATQAAGKGSVKVFDTLHQQIKEVEIFSGESFHGLNINLTDVNLDGVKDVVAGGVKGDEPFVRVVGLDNKMISSFLAYPASFRGGVEVAAGDVDQDGVVDIVTAPQSGLAPVVKIFSQNGQFKKQFTVFNDTYRGGVNLEVGDVNGDGQMDIIVAPKTALIPKIKIFRGSGQLINEFTAYSPKFLGGVNIGLADINLDGKLDILTGAGKTGGPHVQAFTGTGENLASFMAYQSNFKEGVQVTGMDWNKDGHTEIVVVAGPPGGPHVKIFTKQGVLLDEFFPLPIAFDKGVNIEVK